MYINAIRLIVFLSIIAASAFGQNQWPTKGWLTVTPKAVGLIVDSLASLDKELSSGRHGNIDGMLIIRHGYMDDWSRKQ
jgi:hypothetical protein